MLTVDFKSRHAGRAFGTPICAAILSLLLLVPVALQSQAQAAEMRQAPRPQVVGGWQVARVDAAARMAAQAAVSAIRRPNAQLVEINSVETQVVAGINYRLVLTLSDHSRWQAVVWRRLNGKMEVTSIRPFYRAIPGSIR